MRLWHYELLPYLPDLQFKGQLRELVAIMHDIRDKGVTNHILINRVADYDRIELYDYFCLYADIYYARYRKRLSLKYFQEFFNFVFEDDSQATDRKSAEPEPLFKGWHTKEYLRMNMANLAEKHIYGISKSRITDEEWQRLLDGYEEITGEEYAI